MFSRLLIISMVFVISSCSSISGYPDRAESTEAKLVKLQEKYFLPNVDVLEIYQGKNGDAQQKYRNTVIHGRILALDMQFSLFKEAIYSEGISSNLTFDIAGVITGAAGAYSTHTQTSRVLSALSGGIAGSQTAINKNLYFEHTMPALLALMDSQRKNIRTEIIRGLTQPVLIYSLGEALSDLERYYDAGSIPGAIATITATAGQELQQATEKLSIIRDKSFVDPKAAETVDTMLDMIDALPSGAAWNIIESPPSEVDEFVKSAVTTRARVANFDKLNTVLAGTGNDDKAKKILKMIVVLMNERSADNLSKWMALLKSN
jgi:hypothetical protein